MQKNGKKTRSEVKSNKSNTSQKPPLSKEQQNAVRKRIKELKRRNTENKNSTQSVIPYIEMTEDGICVLEEHQYSQTIAFEDCNYRLKDEENKDDVYSAWCNVINYFDSSINYQITYENQYVNNQQTLNIMRSRFSPTGNSITDEIGQEYADIICNQFAQSGEKKNRKLLTYTVKAKNLSAARVKLKSIGFDVVKLFFDVGAPAKILNGAERLESLYRSLNPYNTDEFVFDWDMKHKSGLSTKDFIAPSSMKFKKSSFAISNSYGSVSSINILASSLPDNLVSSLLFFEDDTGNNNNGSSAPGLLSINLHIKPYDQDKALKILRGKLTDLDKTKIDEQKKAARSGYDSDILPPQLSMMIDETRSRLEKLSNNNEKMFIVTVILRNYSKSPSQNALHLEALKREVNKFDGCKLFTLDYQQEDAFSSTLPIGVNNVELERDLTTTELAVFIPFETQELFDPCGCYFGINTITKSVIMANRAKLKNRNGLVLGVPGAGKSFTVKRMILDTFFRTNNFIFINDPEGEYSPLVTALGGQVVKIAASSSARINPLDVIISDDSSEIETTISEKSDFMIAICETIVGERFSLTAQEKTTVDAATRNIYNRFFSNKPSADKMPTLETLLNELKKNRFIEDSQRLCSALEMYVSGSHSLFNCKSNVDINNRIVCFDIRDLGATLKSLAMLIIQDTVWNKVSQNRNLGIDTSYFNDEFHLMLRDEQTAKYVVEIWKRFRKWGGEPTGITQNVKDLLRSIEIENILDNSDFIYLLAQESGDADILAEKLKLPNATMSFVRNVPPGYGVVKYGSVVLPFEDHYPENTKSFELLNTDPVKKKQIEQRKLKEKEKNGQEKPTADIC